MFVTFNWLNGKYKSALLGIVKFVKAFALVLYGSTSISIVRVPLSVTATPSLTLPNHEHTKQSVSCRYKNVTTLLLRMLVVKFVTAPLNVRLLLYNVALLSSSAVQLNVIVALPYWKVLFAGTLNVIVGTTLIELSEPKATVGSMSTR